MASVRGGHSPGCFWDVLGGRRRSRTMARRRFSAPRTFRDYGGDRVRLPCSAWTQCSDDPPGSLIQEHTMRHITAFLKFWDDFIVCDDWTIAASISVAIAATFWLVQLKIEAWWLLPAAAILTLGVSLWRAARTK